MDHVYISIDLKSFYASVECIERGLDPMTTNLVVADPTRTEKTICLAVSPAMKKLGVPGRCRVFEIPKHIDYIMAPPRMQLYVDYSAQIYGVYLKYIAKEDIHVYSIDEVMMDVTHYLMMYQMTPMELGLAIMADIQAETGITSSCGIGSNLYLSKVAMDVLAKRSDDHIASLDEDSYQTLLWQHRPLTDFWRLGKGIATRLEKCGIDTMEKIAKADEEMLYRMFGVDAELLIDHAYGREPVTMEDIKTYKAKTNSLSSGQVLSTEYAFEDAILIAKEMADLLSLELVDQGLITGTITLHVGYANRLALKPAHGTINTPSPTSSTRTLVEHTEQLFRRIVDPLHPIKRMTITYANVVDETYQQYDLFCDPAELEKERALQQAMLSMKHKYGKNAILKGMNLQKEGTTIERNAQIGGHASDSQAKERYVTGDKS